MRDNVSKLIDDYCWKLSKAINDIPLIDVVRVVEVLSKARDMGRQVYIFGNGGSASTASHFASDLNKGVIAEGKRRFKAVCLNDNIPVMTAWANDTKYEHIYAEQLENFVKAGDVVIAISGSGNSPNVLNAIGLAKTKRAFTIGFIGFKGGRLKELVDRAVVVPSDNMERIEDVHLAICHIIKTCLKEKE